MTWTNDDSWDTLGVNKQKEAAIKAKKSTIDNDIKSLRKLARRLSVYNEWRRGSDRDPMPDPEQTGKDIEAAVQAIGEYVEVLKEAEAK